MSSYGGPYGGYDQPPPLPQQSYYPQQQQHSPPRRARGRGGGGQASQSPPYSQDGRGRPSLDQGYGQSQGQGQGQANGPAKRGNRGGKNRRDPYRGPPGRAHSPPSQNYGPPQSYQGPPPPPGYPGPGNYNSGPPPPPQQYGYDRPPPPSDARRPQPPPQNMSRDQDRNQGQRVGESGRDPRDQGGETELIRDRIKRERPCRTLFVRNISYETSADLVRDRFDRIGEIKAFFDLVGTRGMAFITYYDLRPATMAKDAINGTDLNGRQVDVHYSLPKDLDTSKRCDRDKNQGTLRLNVRNAQAPLIEAELWDRFAKYGQLKDIVHSPQMRRDERRIEYWDSRAPERAIEDMDSARMVGGIVELELDWDVTDGPDGQPPLPPPTARDPREERGDRGQWPGGYDNGPPPPLNRDRDYNNNALPPPRDNNYNRDYNSGPPPSRAPPIPAAPIPGSVEDRLEQARKIQELLSTLAGGPPPAVAPVPPSSAQGRPMPPPPTGWVPPSQGNGFGLPPSGAFGSQGPPPPAANGYGGAPTGNYGAPQNANSGYRSPAPDSRQWGAPPPVSQYPAPYASDLNSRPPPPASFRPPPPGLHPLTPVPSLPLPPPIPPPSISSQLPLPLPTPIAVSTPTLDPRSRPPAAQAPGQSFDPRRPPPPKLAAAPPYSPPVPSRGDQSPERPALRSYSPVQPTPAPGLPPAVLALLAKSQGGGNSPGGAMA
ncbi:hypothetical protein P7C70_g8877, partial [Phenoliferia sp. Uapishka_3]